MRRKSKSESVYRFTAAEWDLVCLHDAQGDVLEAADSGGADAVRALLSELAALHFVPDEFHVVMMRGR